jgi:hypothetical protein
MLISSKHFIVAILTGLSSTIAFCQTDALTLSSGVVSPGGTASLNLSLNSSTGTEPAGLEWTLVYSTSAITNITVSIGVAATAAVKVLSCTAGSGSYTCFLTGLSTGELNANMIHNGVVAVVNATISPGTTVASISVTSALGATQSGSAVPIAATGGTITTSEPLSLTLLTCNPTTVLSGASTTCTVTLNQTAPTGGTIVALADNNVLLKVPSSMTVPVGAVSATFAATAGTLITTQSATITASLSGASKTAAVTLVAAVLVSKLTCNPTSLDAGASSTCTLSLSADAPAGGVSVSLSANSSALTVPASANVSAGSSTAAFTATATTKPPSGESTQTVLVTATLNGASQSESFTLIICPCSLWSSTAQPVNPASTNKKAIEVGMQFTSSISGYLTGLRFFKSSTNTGTHVGNLWSSAGAHLAQVDFIDETPSGWQVAYFPTPVAVTAKTTYVISYHAPQGHNAADNGAFTTSVGNLPLQALADGQSGPNGVYGYGPSEFPTTGSSATNYWVDVIFNTSVTIGTAAPVSVWSPTAIPNAPAVASSLSTELGLTFMSEVPGYITGLRFYKSSNNLGTHIGHLWTATGTLLASVTFTNESTSGWQQANFATPVAINVSTPYVISYWSPKGHYADDAEYFATSGVTNQMLYAPPNGQYGPNGSYATDNAFPSSSTSSSNYWVDVVFTTAIE